MATALPARLRHPGHRTLVRELAQADATQAELAIDRARTAAPVTARVGPHLVLGPALLLDDERLLGHLLIPSVSCERQAEGAQQGATVLVRRRRRGDRDVEPADRRHLVVVDLGKDDLLPDPDRVVSPPVERPGVEASEISDTGKGDRCEPVEELVHARPAEGHARADGHPLAQLEARDRLGRAPYLRALSGDDRELVDCRVERFRVRLRLADTHVQGDLRDTRNLHDGGDAELLVKPRADLTLVPLLEPRRVGLCCRRGSHHLSISWPHPSRLHTRTRTISPLISFSAMATLVGLPQTGQTTITFDTGTAAALSRMPPGTTCAPPMREESRIGRGRVCRFCTLRFSTMTRRSEGRASSTRPRFPRSLPA